MGMNYQAGSAPSSDQRWPRGTSQHRRTAGVPFPSRSGLRCGAGALRCGTRRSRLSARARTRNRLRQGLVSAGRSSAPAGNTRLGMGAWETPAPGIAPHPRALFRAELQGQPAAGGERRPAAWSSPEARPRAPPAPSCCTQIYSAGWLGGAVLDGHSSRLGPSDPTAAPALQPPRADLQPGG
jgi:hypothetical protein